AAARAGLAKKQFSAVELADAHLVAIERAHSLNAFVQETPERAREMAKASDARFAAGKPRPLEGIPLAIKDMFCTKDVRTAACSRILDNFVPTYDSTVTAQLWRDGAVLLGKTNNDEFAMGSSNETSYCGPVTSPWRRKGSNTPITPGGSSGGSAAAVAAQLCLGATGTDTGGSIRQPAALTNLTGLKPTYGRVSRWGMIAYASSLDQGGPLARTAEDCAILLQGMAGFDPNDSTSIDEPVPDYSASLNGSLQGLRIGVPKEYFSAGLDPRIADLVMASVEELKKLGAVIKEISLPNMQHAIPAYYVIAPAEASSNLSRFDGVRFGYRCEDPKNLEDLYKRSRGEGFGPEVQRRIMVGAYALSAGYYDAYYLKAQKIRRLIKNDFMTAFNEVDIILGPTTPNPAWKLGAKNSDPVAAYLEDVYTITANLAGLPGLSMPAGFVDGLPVGVQLLAPYFQEGRLLNVAHQYQLNTDWHTRTPTGF
ncbi:MAG: Asp-tRNA(Asn)/Glu-tRNA(Gln) amidotransferase subunit GatA, partial [bacterium]